MDDEGSLYRSASSAGARAVLIGRQALIALGLPVLTNDDDFWVHLEDLQRFHAAARPNDAEDLRLLEVLRGTHGT
jgi:hypothetical protein